MDDPPIVGVAQRISDFAGNLQRRVHRQLLLAAQALAQRLPLDQRHHVVEQPVGVAGIIERQDVRMMQAGGDLDLTEEALGTQGGRQLGTEYFHGHLAVVLQILGEINQSHPPHAQLALEPIPVGERRGEAKEGVRHRSLLRVG